VPDKTFTNVASLSVVITKFGAVGETIEGSFNVTLASGTSYDGKFDVCRVPDKS
jgi:hypothetical protein